MTEKYMVPMKVRNYHIDSYGHVNNARYLILLEEARTQFMDDFRVPLEEYVKQGIYLTITEIHIKYKKPAVLGDQLEIFIWFPVLKKAKVVFKQEIRLAGSGDLIATAMVTCGSIKNGRVIGTPKDFLQVMQAYYIPDQAIY